MKTVKALEVNMDLVQIVANAAIEALKAGMTKEEVSAVLVGIAEIIDNSDD